MKKLLFVVCAIVFHATSLYSQEKFSGIGKLKIGIDTLELQSMLEGSGIKLKNATKSMDVYLLNKNSAVKIIYPTNGGFMADASPVQSVNVYHIKEIDIAGILVKNIYLRFYNNKLYSVRTAFSSELKQAMEIKYPDYKFRSKKDTTQCLAKTTGNKYDLVATDFITTWESGSITAEMLLGEYYDKNCQKSIISWFKYQDNIIDVDVRNKEGDIKKSMAETQKQNLKQTLKDF